MATKEVSGKTVSVRIGKDQANRLREIVDQFPGGSINGVVQRAVDLWLEKEGTVYLAALREARGRLAQTKEAVQGRHAAKQEKHRDSSRTA
jgi:Arc/MetJ-type ribon-helix-helix transcriptional regulator